MQSWAKAMLSGLISFVFVALATFMTLEASPLWAGVVWAVPYSICSAIVVMYATKEPDYKAFKLLISAGFAMVGLIVQMIVWGFIIKSKFLDDRLTRYWGGFGISMVAWLLVVGAFVAIVHALPADMRISF